MGWKTTSVVTTQVMDENPMTWLKAAANSFYESDFLQGMERVDKALEFGKSNSEVLVRGYAYKILLLYGLKNNGAARSFFEEKRNKVGLEHYLNNNAEILIMYLKFDSEYWKNAWKKLNEEKIIQNDLSFFKKYQKYIPTETQKTWESKLSIINQNRSSHKKWVCGVCGWTYDEAAGYPEYDLAPNVAFGDLPKDFVCPLCGICKDYFEEMKE